MTRVGVARDGVALAPTRSSSRPSSSRQGPDAVPALPGTATSCSGCPGSLPVGQHSIYFDFYPCQFCSSQNLSTTLISNGDVVRRRGRRGAAGGGSACRHPRALPLLRGRHVRLTPQREMWGARRSTFASSQNSPSSTAAWFDDSNPADQPEQDSPAAICVPLPCRGGRRIQSQLRREVRGSPQLRGEVRVALQPSLAPAMPSTCRPSRRPSPLHSTNTCCYIGRCA